MTFATANHFRHAALSILKKSRRGTFASFFGCNEHVCTLTWNMFDLGDLPNVTFKHLLWALMFLKIYAVDSILCQLCGVSSATFRKYRDVMVQRIAALRVQVVSVGVAVVGSILA